MNTPTPRERIFALLDEVQDRLGMLIVHLYLSDPVLLDIASVGMRQLNEIRIVLADARDLARTQDKESEPSHSDGCDNCR